MKKNGNKLKLTKAEAKLASMIDAAEGIGDEEWSSAEFAEAYDKVQAQNVRKAKKEADNLMFATYLKKETFTVAETAYKLGCDNKTVYRLLKRKLLDSLKGLRTKQITSESIERYKKTAI